MSIHTALLHTTQESHFYTYVYNSYSPLTKEQADLFMKGKKYNNYVKHKLDVLCYYIDKNNKRQRLFRSNQKTRLTDKDIKNLRKNELIKIKKEDKGILMSEGIGGLPPAHDLSYEDSILRAYIHAPSDKEKCLMLLCCFPCIIKQDCCPSESTFPERLSSGEKLNFF